MDIRSLFKRTRKEERGSTALTLAVIALFLALNLIIVAVGGALGFYMSIIDKSYYELSGATDEYFAALNPDGKRVNFYFCRSADALSKDYTLGRILDTLLQFDERYEFFSVSHLDVYYDYTFLAEIAEKNDTSIDESSVIAHCPDTGESIVRSLSTFYIYNTEDSTDQDMIFNGEEIVAAMVSRVLGAKYPKAYFTTGHGETAPVSMQSLLYAAGYDILTADLSLYEIEEDCELIVISNPRYDFEEYASVEAKSEISRLREFVARGGKVLVLRPATLESLPRLDAFLASYGMTVNGGTIVRHDDMSIGANSASILLEYAKSDAAAAIGARAESVMGERVLFGISSALTLTEGEGYRVSPLLQSYGGSTLSKNGEVLDKGVFTVMAMSEVDTNDGRTGGVICAASATLGDGSLLDMGSFGNEAFLYSLLEKTCGRTVPIGCGVVVLNTYPLSNLTKNTADGYFALLAVALPLACAGLGAVIIIRRKRR